jgi:predicted esterase
MRCSWITLAVLLALPVALPAVVHAGPQEAEAGKAQDNPKLDPATASPGTTAQWAAKDGLPYEYHVPADYDPARGSNLTVVLHGNGLDHRWTFWNHPADKFRQGDIVVSPDGTTFHKGTNANEFLGEAKDAERFHALLEELKQTWKVRDTFLYGHSQGSFFVFYYAGAYPDDVAGVAGHASGAWNWTQMGSRSKHVAIGIMHGTADGNVPYGQSWWTRKVYLETAKYPLVHLRTLFGWGHQPHWRQAEQVLAWCEGMTTTDPGRLAASLGTLSAAEVPQGHDWSALWAVADRLAQDERAPEDQRARGAAVAAEADALAGRHIAAIEAAAGGAKAKTALKKLGPGPAAGHGHFIRFLEEFDGVPARDQWVAKHKALVNGLQDAGEEHYKDYLAEQERAPDKAAKAGLALLETGYTHYEALKVLSQLDAWVKRGTIKLSERDAARLEELGGLYRAARKEGFAAYAEVNATATLAP